MGTSEEGLGVLVFFLLRLGGISWAYIAKQDRSDDPDTYGIGQVHEGHLERTTTDATAWPWAQARDPGHDNSPLGADPGHLAQPA